MPRLPRTHRYAKYFFLLSALIFSVLLIPNPWRVGAQSSVSEPVVLPGDLGSLAAAGRQEQPQIARGADSFLAVWRDSRTQLSSLEAGNSLTTIPQDGSGLGTMTDIYAARLDANGQVLDTTPIVVSQAFYDQSHPRVAWNGQNFLVVWLTTHENDRYSFDLLAARISPAGALLDQTPIVIKAAVSDGTWPQAVIEDGAGNWVVVWESALPQEGTNIPVGVLVARVAGDGTVLDPGGRVVYNHHSQFMGNSDLARAGDRYLLTFMTFGPPYNVMGVLLDANFNELRNGPELLSQNGNAPRVGSNGDTWLAVWSDGASGNVQSLYGTRVDRNGDPTGARITIKDNIGTAPTQAQVCWDGANWHVAYENGFDSATQTYLNSPDIYVSRVAASGAVLDPSGIAVKASEGVQNQPALAPAASGGAQVVWHDANPSEDIRTARLSTAGTTSADAPVSLGARRQTRQRMAAGSDGYLSVFRDDASGIARIMGQRLDATGAVTDAEPFVIADGVNNNPSVAWNGSQYLVVWDSATPEGAKTFGRFVPATGTSPASEPFFIMNGITPDAAAVGSTFLVVNILPGHEVLEVQAVKVSASGALVGTPFIVIPNFNKVPRVASLGGHWLVVSQWRVNHDDGTYSIRGAFISPPDHTNPLSPTPFAISSVGGTAPHIAVAGDSALVVWSNGDIYGRRISAAGPSVDLGSDLPISTAPGQQLQPAVAWDGNQYVATWIDQRNEGYPLHPRGDIYGARVAHNGVALEEFVVANSPLPEETPFVVAGAGRTIFSYARFYNDKPEAGRPAFTAYRITLRAASFPAPDAGAVPEAPSNLVATQVGNYGIGTVGLKWADNSRNETGFKVEMRTGASGEWRQIKLLGADATSVGGISVGTTAQSYFRVRAYNANGDSVYSNEATPPLVTTALPSGSTYYEPANVTINASVSSSNPIAQVEFYYRRDGEAADTLLGTDTVAPYSFNWTNVERGSYEVRVKAIDAQGSSILATDQGGVFVKRKPSAQITSPLEGSLFTQPVDITFSATAQVNNNRSDEYVERVDFYDGTRWIGRGQSQVFGGPFTFVWTNAPTGAHTITAHATSSWGDFGVSSPIHINVNPQTPPEPDLNIKPNVSLMAPANGADFPAGATIAASATADDPDGQVVRVEFRADGQLVEADTSAPYSINMNLAGGAHAVTATAFDNRGASNTSAAVQVSIARSGSAQITSNAYDGQSSFGPSVVTQAGPPVDKEFADDFDVNGDIDRLVVRGSTSGYNSPTYPTIKGAYVRFYAWENGNPGVLQDQMFLPTGSSGLVYDARQPATFDITLPHSFRANGKHFVSVQLLVEGYSAYWYVLSANTGATQNSAVRQRDNYGSGAWSPVSDPSGVKNSDISISLYGTLNSAGNITNVAPQTVERSGWITVTGTNFGATQGGSRLLVDRIGAIVVKWSNTEIIGYVPETARLGSMPVEVSNPVGTSNAAQINVTDRQPDGRIRWRAKIVGDYLNNIPAVAPQGSPEPGTVYVSVDGLIYAWSPNGALKWIVRAGSGGPISVGPDGTIYAADSVRNSAGLPRAAVTAINRDGTQKWQIVDSTAFSMRAGPNVGPDGKIYAVFSTGQYNTVALNANGTVAWSRNDQIGSGGGSNKELAFGRALQRFYYGFSAGSTSTLFATDFDGNRVFTSTSGCCQTPSVAPDENLRHLNQSISSQNGSVLYSFPGGSPASAAASAGPDNTHYMILNYSRLYAVKPDGTEKWHYFDSYQGTPGNLYDPVASPTNNLVLMGGNFTTATSGFFVAVNAATGEQLWKQVLPNELAFQPYGQIWPDTHPVFTPDGSTAYIAGDVAGDGDSRYTGTRYGFLYAVNTTPGNVPVNQPPRVTIMNPLPNSNVPRGSEVTVTAAVEDDGEIDRVEFRYNRNGSPALLGTDTTRDENGLYSVPLATNEPGGFGLYAVAYDKEGLRADSSLVTVLIYNEQPSIRWVSPADGATFINPSSITLKAHAADVDGTITRVEFNSGNVGLLGADTTPDANGDYELTWTNPPSGTHSLYAWANDNDGGRIGTNISVQINPTPTPTPAPTPTPTPTPVGAPVVAISAPATGASFPPGTTVTVMAEASDPDGTIARVDFYEGPFGELRGSDVNAPYTLTYTGQQAGVHNFFAIATDNAGNATRSNDVQVVFHDPNAHLSINGRIRHNQSTPTNEIFLPNALVRLKMNDRPYRETRTDAGGNYVFDHLDRGRYTVEPAEPGYEFYPGAVALEGLSKNETLDFVTAGPLPPGPTPTPTPGSPVLAWEQYYDSSQHLADFDTKVAVDPQGNTYVTGTTNVIGGRGDTDISTVKYSPTGEQLWAATWAGIGNYKDWANDIKVDAGGNAYVTGVSWRGSSYEYDAVTIKYDASGNEQWTRLYNSPIGHVDRGEALALVKDNSGHATAVVVGGYSAITTPNGLHYDEIIAVKYDADGNEQWVKRHTTEQGGDYGNAITVDAAGNSYVSGYAYTPTTGTRTKYIVVVKFSPNGQELWTARFNHSQVGDPGPAPLPNNPLQIEPGNIALDPSGNVYVSGSSTPGNTQSDYLLLKFDASSGALVWNRSWAGQYTDYARDMAIDAGGNIYLTGESYDGAYYSATQQSTSDVATVKFNGEGNLVWERIYRGFPGKWDGGRSIALDSSGNVYVGLYSSGFVNSDSAVVKYKSDGTEVWVYRYDNQSHSDDSLIDMASDAAGNLYLSGQALIVNAGGVETTDFVTVKLKATTNLNLPPDITVGVGPTIAGEPVKSDESGTSGPTIAGRTITLNASAFDHDGNVTRVEFYDGAFRIGSDNTAPYSIQWDAPSLGTHAIIASATDDSGATRASQTLSVNIVAEPAPSPTPTPEPTPTPTPTPTPVPTPIPAPTGSTGEPVIWHRLVGASASTNSLTALATGWGNSGASSSRAISSGDGFVEFIASESNTHRMLGLSSGDSNQHFSDIDFALYLTNSSSLIVYESGVAKGSFGSYASGDHLRISIEGGTIKYSKNGAVFYQHSVSPTYPLLVDTSLYDTGATLGGVTLSGSLMDVTTAEGVAWTNMVGTSATGSSLRKSSADAGWAGAVSTRAIASGDGYVEFIATETDTHRMLGLSNGDSNQGYSDIDYAIYLTNAATVMVYEGGTARGTFASYQAGDQLRISIEGGRIKYSRNGATFYEHAAEVSYPLLVDTSLYNTNATLTEVALSGSLVNVGPPATVEQVVWQNVVGASVTGNSLTATATGWGSSGAVSTKAIASGDGYMELIATETDKHRMVGLGSGDTSQHFSDIEYAMYLTNEGSVLVYESGVYQGEYGRYREGDRLRVAIEGGKVKYLRNGAVFYEHGVTPIYPLMVDTSLYDMGATLNNVTMSGTLTP